MPNNIDVYTTTYNLSANGDTFILTVGGVGSGNTSGGGGASSFLDLTDAPHSYTGSNGKFVQVAGTGLTFADAGDPALRSEVGSITASLESQILAISANGSGATTALVASVSATLQTEITSESSTRASADTSLQNQINSIQSFDVAVSNLTGSFATSSALATETSARIAGDATLTPLTTTAAVSATLQGEITANGASIAAIQAFDTAIASASASFATTTYVGTVSGNLATSIASEASQRAAADLLLTPLATTASTSANLQAQINGIQTFDSQIAFISGAWAYQFVVVSVSGQLSDSINTESVARSDADALLTPLTTTAAISAGLDSRITTNTSNISTNTTNIANLNTWSSQMASASGSFATTSYVDTQIQGLEIKGPVFVATTGNITLFGEQTIDGQLTSNSRVLVKDQTNAYDNGLYVSSAGAWTRTSDMNTWSEVDGAIVFVQAGTTNINTMWRATTGTLAGTFGIDNITWNSYTNDEITRSEVSAISGGLDSRITTNTSAIATNTTAISNIQTFDSQVGNLTGSFYLKSGGVVTGDISAASHIYVGSITGAGYKLDINGSGSQQTITARAPSGAFAELELVGNYVDLIATDGTTTSRIILQPDGSLFPFSGSTGYLGIASLPFQDVQSVSGHFSNVLQLNGKQVATEVEVAGLTGSLQTQITNNSNFNSQVAGLTGSTWVKKSGDTMTGALNISGAVHTKTDLHVGGELLVDGTTGQLLNVGTKLVFDGTNQILYSGDGLGKGQVEINGAAANDRALRFDTNYSDRWILKADSTNEAGSNAGSNLNLSAYDDSGTLIDSPMTVARVSGGAMTVNRPVFITTNETISGGLTVGGSSVLIGSVNISGQFVHKLKPFMSLEVASQTLPQSSWTLCTFATSGAGISGTADTGNNWDNSLNRFNPPIAGIYNFKGQLAVQVAGSTNYSKIQIWKNGSFMQEGVIGTNTVGGGTRVAWIDADIVVSSTSDYYQIYGFTDSSTGRQIGMDSASAGNTYFYIEFMGVTS